ADTNGDGLLEWWGVSKPYLGSSSATLVRKEYDTQTSSFTTENFTSAPTHVIDKGDVNGDGLDDVVGSFDQYEYYDTYQGIINGAGGIWAFYGDSQGVDSNSSWEAYGEDSSVKLGTNIDILDVDGDDIDDILVSGWAGGFLFYGALQSYTDSNGNPRDPRSSDAEAVIEFGNTLYRGVQNAGDQNQDGFDDFLIGGNYQKTEIYLFFGGEN
ncbi:MAG: hypothetical protein CL916_12525, partial [Deltaproteobacteria bacterium]|nr:hypothetical protein [Deltaproteobacteria bacterium]